MITPGEIQTKLERLYPQAIEAWLKGDDHFFPHPLRVGFHLADSVSENIKSMEALRAHAKESIGYGYRIEYREIHKRKHGLNNYPSAIWIDSLEDLLAALSKKSEWRRLDKAIHRLAASLPALREWWIKNWRKVLDVEAELTHLIQVAQYIQEHPRPGCFPRELPLAVPTKLVMNHRTLLSEWFDILLPPHAIDFGVPARDFERRYGFRSAYEHLRIRFLDPNLQASLDVPFEECSLPAAALANWNLQGLRVIICENKVNWLTLPHRHLTLAFGGLGRGVTQLFDIPWLEQADILYWGDIDVDGLEILASVRRRFPQTQSLLMDQATLEQFEALCTTFSSRHREPPDELTDTERQAFNSCLHLQRRLEQEHIPQDMVEQLLR